MPGGQTKYFSAWLQHVDSNEQKISEWCRKGKDDFHGYCKFCGIDIKCDNAGKAQLLQHAYKKKHKEAIKHYQDNMQSKLYFPATQIQKSTNVVVQPSSSSLAGSSTAASSQIMGCIHYGDAGLEAEIYWLAKIASSNYSLRSSDHIGDLFRVMFPDSKVAENFSLSHTSSSYIIADGLAPYFKKVIISDLVESKLPFSLHFDETSTTQVKKQMDLTLRYWSPTHDEVWTSFYTSLFFGHAEGIPVAVKMYETMQNDGIPVDKLITLV